MVKIGYLQKCSLIDFGSYLSAVIFTQGCNFKCPYCHNPELVCPSLFNKSIYVDEVLSFLKTRQGKLDAVVITGGEPTLHKNLPEFIKQIKSLGFKVKLDTNGTNPSMLKSLIANNLLDYIAMDIKGPKAKYKYIVRAEVDMEAITKSYDLIVNSNIDHEFRTTVVDELMDEQDIKQIATDFGNFKRYFIQNFVASKTLDETFMQGQGFTDETLKTICNFFDDSQIAVR